MYCIKCGVKLSDGQDLCPLCGIRVYHPDLPDKPIKPTYPRKEFQSEEFNRKGLLFVITVLWLLPLIMPVLFELLWHKEVTWSGFAASGVLLTYLYFILPAWFRHANPVIFLSCDVAAGALYLAYINYSLGGSWFLPFAMPVLLSFGAIMIALVALHRYVHRGYLYIYGGGVIALGAWTVLLEYLIQATFAVNSPVYWSPFSATTLLILGLLLILIAIIKPLRESLYRMFFIGSVR